MTNEEILAELRTIRTLLVLDKEEELDGILNGLSEVQQKIIEEVNDEWNTLPTSEIADECDVSTNTVRRGAGDLIERHLIERRGRGSGTEYRETGLLRAVELTPSN